MVAVNYCIGKIFMQGRLDSVRSFGHAHDVLGEPPDEPHQVHYELFDRVGAAGKGVMQFEERRWNRTVLCEL